MSEEKPDGDGGEDVGQTRIPPFETTLGLIEALLFRLYVIAYDSPGGVSEMLEDGKFGSLIPSGNRKKFVSDLIKNLNNSNVKNQDITEHLELFKPDNVTKKYIDLIEEIS